MTNFKTIGKIAGGILILGTSLALGIVIGKKQAVLLNLADEIEAEEAEATEEASEMINEEETAEEAAEMINEEENKSEPNAENNTDKEEETNE